MASGREDLAAWLSRTCMSHKALATRLRISEPYMSQLLSGRRTPGLELATDIMVLTGVPAVSWVDKVAGNMDTMVTRRVSRARVSSVKTGVSTQLTESRFR